MEASGFFRKQIAEVITYFFRRKNVYAAVKEFRGIVDSDSNIMRFVVLL